MCPSMPTSRAQEAAVVHNTPRISTKVVGSIDQEAQHRKRATYQPVARALNGAFVLCPTIPEINYLSPSSERTRTPFQSKEREQERETTTCDCHRPRIVFARFALLAAAPKPWERVRQGRIGASEEPDSWSIAKFTTPNDDVPDVLALLVIFSPRFLLYARAVNNSLSLLYINGHGKVRGSHAEFYTRKDTETDTPRHGSVRASVHCIIVRWRRPRRR